MVPRAPHRAQGAQYPDGSCCRILAVRPGLSQQHPWGTPCPPAPQAGEMLVDRSVQGAGWASLAQPSPHRAVVAVQGPALSTSLLLKPNGDFGALQYKLINFYVLINASY